MLDELDGMDWGRLMRARAAAEMERIEDVRDLYLQDKHKPTPDEWRRILWHDRLWDGSTNQQGKQQEE